LKVEAGVYSLDWSSLFFPGRRSLFSCVQAHPILALKGNQSSRAKPL